MSAATLSAAQSLSTDERDIVDPFVEELLAEYAVSTLAADTNADTTAVSFPFSPPPPPPPPPRTAAAAAAAAAAGGRRAEDVAAAAGATGVPAPPQQLIDPELAMQVMDFRRTQRPCGGAAAAAAAESATTTTTRGRVGATDSDTAESCDDLERSDDTGGDGAPRAVEGRRRRRRRRRRDPLASARELSQRNIDSVCNDFVARFLQQGGSVADLHEDLKKCNAHLLDMEEALREFLARISRVCEDIEDLRQRASRVSVRASNTAAVERVVAEVLSHLVVPPDVIQVIISSNEYNLGQQFTHSVQKLLRILRYRQGHWERLGQPPGAPSAALATTPSASFRLQSRANTALEVPASHAPPPHSAASLASSFSEVAESTCTHSGAGEFGDGAQREVHLHLHECRAYHEVLSVLDEIVVFASLKIKAFLLQVMAVLAKPHSNIAIQQTNVLLPHKRLVAFLRHAPPLLRHVHHCQRHPTTAGATTAAAASAPLAPFRIVQSLYVIVKTTYESLLARVYYNKTRQYLNAMHALEKPHLFAGGGGEGNDTDDGGGGGGGVAGGSSSSGWTSFFSRAVSSHSTAAHAAPAAQRRQGTTRHMPLLTDTSANVSARDFSLGERAAVFENLFAPPLLPHVERLSNRRHFYEETFRSINVLLMDAVTSEFLFSFEFFAADTSVYVEAFRSTIQLVIDYVSDVVLRHSAPSNALAAGAETSSDTDAVGLLCLIRLTHLFKVHMHHTRKIHCLDGFYDALLLLLWPALKNALQRQLQALRALQPTDAAAFITGFRTVEDRLAAEHPVAQRYAELSASLMLLGAPIPLPTHKALMPAAGAASTFSTAAAAPPTPMQQRAKAPGAGEANGGDASPSPSRERHPHRRAAVRRAVFAAMVEQDDDVVESAHRFQAMRTNLSVLRIDFERLMTATAAEVAARGEMLQHGSSEALGQRPLASALRVNNFFTVLRRWAVARPVKRDAHGAFNVSDVCIAGDPTNVTATGSTDFTGHGMMETGEGGDGSNDDSGETGGGCGRGHGRTPLRTGGSGRFGDSRAVPCSPPAYLRAAAAAGSRAGGDERDHSENSIIEIDGGGSGGSSNAKKGQSYTMASCTSTPDFADMQKAFEAAKAEFVEQALQLVFPQLLAAVCAVDTLPPTRIEQHATEFVAKWRNGLERVRTLARACISDPDNALDVLKQLFMQTLLYNTRLHTLVGSIAAPTRPVRLLIVSNQQLMAAMRQMVSLDNGPDAYTRRDAAEWSDSDL